MTQAEYDEIRDQSTQALEALRKIEAERNEYWDEPQGGWLICYECGGRWEKTGRLTAAEERFEKARAAADAAVLVWINQLENTRKETP